jgi:hypothetical protein
MPSAARVPPRSSPSASSPWSRLRHATLVTRLVLLTSLLLTAACAEPPTKELDQAQGAIEAARAAGADQYAADEIRAAADALARAHVAVGQRDYRQALSLAIDAKERARDAARTSAERMARHRSDAEQAIDAAVRALAASEQRLTADAPRLSAAQHATFTGGLTAARQALQEARTAFDKQTYAQARAGADTAMTRIRETMTTLSDAETRARRPPARK